MVGGLPAKGTSAHPVVCVGEGDGADAVDAGEIDGSLHGCVGVHVADAAIAVPALNAAEGRRACRDGAYVDAPVPHHGLEARKTIESVGVDAIAGGFSKETGRELCCIGRKPKTEHRSFERATEISEGDAEHDRSLEENAISARVEAAYR